MPSTTSSCCAPTVSGPIKRRFTVPVWLAGEYAATLLAFTKNLFGVLTVHVLFVSEVVEAPDIRLLRALDHPLEALEPSLVEAVVEIGQRFVVLAGGRWIYPVA